MINFMLAGMAETLQSKNVSEITSGFWFVFLCCLKVQSGIQSMCKQTCKHLVRCTLHISKYLLIFGQSHP